MRLEDQSDRLQQDIASERHTTPAKESAGGAAGAVTADRHGFAAERFRQVIGVGS